MRNLFKIPGGKFYLKSFIISHFPSHQRYTEPFVGGGSIILNKSLSQQEVINDIHPGIYGIYYTLKHFPNKFIKDVKKIEYDEWTFQKALHNEYPFALNELILRRMSRGGLKKSFSWSNRLRNGDFGDRNAWNSYKILLPQLASRLKTVEIYNKPALEIVQQYDDENTLQYLDPPYIPSSRTSKNLYEFEMTEKDHIELLELINNCESKIIISGYSSELYDKYLQHWNRDSKIISNHSGQNKKKNKRTECLWMNF